MDLKNLDVEFLLDRSGSMVTADCPGGKSRWDYARETTLALATHMAKYDADGITVVPFSSTSKVYEGVTPDKVTQIFTENQPMGGTNTAAVLKARLDAYFTRKAAQGAATKPTVIFVMTDGVPDDQGAVASVIVEATKKMDRDEELAISFIQVGADAGATKFLTQLDDELVKPDGTGAKFDIVDALPISEVENLTAEQLVEKAFAD